MRELRCVAITREKDLRTGVPVWAADPLPHVKVHELRSDQAADVAIVGAGISGAMVAQELSAAGHKVILLDKRAPMRGSTAVTTALAQYDLDTPLIDLEKKIGIEKAVRAWHRSKNAMQQLADRLVSLRIECDPERVPSVQLAGDVMHFDRMKAEHQLRKTNDLPVEFLDRKSLLARFGIDRDAALVSSGDLQMHPLKMTAGFLNAAIGNGARIFSPVEVKEVNASSSGVELLTDRGAIVRARSAVFATGYEVLKYVNTDRHQIDSTYVIATRPQPERIWPERAMIWEAADPYLYIRATRDGRVICGGEDEQIADAEARDALLPEKTRTLQRKLKELFPLLDTEAEFAWTGTFGASTTGLPSIGNVPGLPNCFAILAFSGNGMIFSRIAADLIGKAIQGISDPDADLFALPE